jgi:hypothetical protein
VLAVLAVATLLAVTAVTLMGDEDSLPPPAFATFAGCSTGAISLSDTECDGRGGCKSKTMRLTWSREGGAVFEGDGTTEREVARLVGSRLGALLTEVTTALDPHPNDGPDRVCASNGNDLRSCPSAGRRLGINAECARGGQVGQVLMRTTVGQRLNGGLPRCVFVHLRKSELALLGCRARGLVRDLFGTHQSDRVIKMMERMKAVATGTGE